MKLKHTILFFLLLCSSIFTNSSLFISSTNELNNIPVIIMPYIDNNQKLIEDESSIDQIGIPLRFAELTEVNFNTENSGKWYSYNEDYNVWKLSIISHDAIGLKLFFNQFQLSENSVIYIYNESQETIIGPITHEDNHIDNAFSHKLLKGSSIYIEYFVPTENMGVHQLQISRIYSVNAGK